MDVFLRQSRQRLLRAIRDGEAAQPSSGHVSCGGEVTT
jgi:hypothetical protein